MQLSYKSLTQHIEGFFTCHHEGMTERVLEHPVEQKERELHLLFARQFLEAGGNRDLLLHPGANTSVFALRKLAAASDGARQNLLRQE